ncbi:MULTISPECIES: TIGR03750 family conjugal transfer protein [unclassified Pseudomonas]|uniref:TIGR03750 family conjugal transfer protein n=1 Tax=unclassified Pseudomonas TaxID=196821 RepID=UPI0024572DBA|nr:MULTISPECIES: TIGR03750 family conjugal transfer protein [unclassified Pseudomonas]MDH4564507.1 TIGR03750 family conjugal transfer protein [Pseudomonas sp. BN411]MDH4655296.1 TIGR03750 family conjugal transfer protein [Pseudomonas sp. BN606]
MSDDIRKDGTVAFLPHRLNHHPVVVRGLTANELWVCAGVSSGLGLVAGIPLAIAFATVAMIPTAMVLAVAGGVFIGGGAVRRIKRGRPEVWLYRHLQWWFATHLPPLAALVGGHSLVTRSGYWTTRRSHAP